MAAYTTIDKPSDHFNTKLYTGNGGTQSITGVGFQPDWVWMKERSETRGHNIQDSLRGATKYLDSRSDAAEATVSNTLTAFGSDGFSLGSYDDVNKSSQTYVAWNWKANGSGSANTAGSINTTATSVNTTAGFSISTYTGNNTSGATIGHGLGVKPNVIIIKQRNAGSSYWITYHDKVSSAPETDYVALNSTDAVADADVFWNDTEPTSTLITLGNDGWVNGSSTTHVCYAFAEKQGYSKFGSYIGNGNANGTFVYTGFKPAFVLCKNTGNGGAQWLMVDNKRVGINPIENYVQANSSSAEATGTDNYDFLSNGFKIRANSSSINANASAYIWFAFGQSLVGSNNVPCTAR